MVMKYGDYNYNMHARQASRLQGRYLSGLVAILSSRMDMLRRTPSLPQRNVARS